MAVASVHGRGAASARQPARRAIPRGGSPATDRVAQLKDLLDASPTVARLETVQRQASPSNGLPDNLRAGLEATSGVDMSGVRLHRNSPEPARIQAAAYTRGSDIYLGPGQEQHLPHEAWHVVQQAQGRVPTTGSVGGMALNDDVGLEREADRMGDRAARWSPSGA